MPPDVNELLLDLVTMVYFLLSENGYCTRAEALEAIQGYNDEFGLCPDIDVIDLGAIETATVEDFMDGSKD